MLPLYTCMQFCIVNNDKLKRQNNGTFKSNKS
nr:MAG TPA: hypothetical protein [Caudoviricetes sp.]